LGLVVCLIGGRGRSGWEIYGGRQFYAAKGSVFETKVSLDHL
jgi:hypothetical protein